MNWLLTLPILTPFLTAILSLLFWDNRRAQRLLSLSGAVLLLAFSCVLLAKIWNHGIQTTQIGSWKAPFGITLVADLFSSILVLMTGIAGLAVVAFSLTDIDAERESFGYHPMLHILLMGVCGAFLTGDIFNLYVWFEVMLIASFVLLGLGGERAQLEGTIKYVTLNLLSSALFLAGIGVLYGAVGTLNMADLASHIGELKPRGLIATLATIFILAFGIKAAIFPLFFWLPASYHTPPAPVSALFAGVLTKVGIYSLVRVYTLIFVTSPKSTLSFILVLAGLTMVTGIMGALVQKDFRRILSFNLVGHMGYLIMGFGLFTPLAFAGMIFYLVHDVLVKTSLFLLSGTVYRLRGTYHLGELGGLYVSHPGLSLLFAVPALSLAGIPPFSGFWGKLALVESGLEANQYLLVAAALFAAILTLFSMAQIWSDVFWRKAPEKAPEESTETGRSLPARSWVGMCLPITVLVLLTVLLGLWPEPVFVLATRAAAELLDPARYIHSVLGNGI